MTRCCKGPDDDTQSGVFPHGAILSPCLPTGDSGSFYGFYVVRGRKLSDREALKSTFMALRPEK